MVTGTVHLRRILPALAGSLFFVLACASSPPAHLGPITMQDGMEVNTEAWAGDSAVVRKRAAFEFTCPPEQVRLTVLTTAAEWRAASSVALRASHVGAEACGKKAVYVLAQGQWLMNTLSAEAR